MHELLYKEKIHNVRTGKHELLQPMIKMETQKNQLNEHRKGIFPKHHTVSKWPFLRHFNP